MVLNFGKNRWQVAMGKWFSMKKMLGLIRGYCRPNKEPWFKEIQFCEQFCVLHLQKDGVWYWEKPINIYQKDNKLNLANVDQKRPKKTNKSAIFLPARLLRNCFSLFSLQKVSIAGLFLLFKQSFNFDTEIY